MFLSFGNITYFGNANEVLDYTDKLYQEAGMGQAPAGNPPEVFLDFCDTLQLEGRIKLVTDHYINKDADVVTSSRLQVGGDVDNGGIVYANSMAEELSILCSRAVRNIFRTKELFIGRLFASIFFGVLIGTLFLNTGNEGMKDLNLRLSYFVFTIAFYYYTSLEALPIFLGEREIFMREYSRGAYRAVSYTIASTLVQLPFQFLLALVYNSITWFLVGLNHDADMFFFQVLCTFTVLATGGTFANMMSVVVPNPMAGQTAGSGLFSVMFLFSGFFIKMDDIPKYWYWLHYSSLFKYAYESMIVNAFEDNASAPGMDNEQVLEFYSVNDTPRGQGVGILWAWLFFFRLVFYYRLVIAFSGSRK